MNMNILANPQAHEALARLRGIPLPGDVIGGKYLVETPCRRGAVALELTAVAASAPPVSAARVDIRLLPPEWCDDAGIVERFLYEGQAAAPLQSEHVVRVFDVGTMEGGAPYFVLEHLEGAGADELLATWGSVPVPMAIDWVLQAAEAVAEAHARGVVHRRLKTASLVLAQRADGTRTIKVRDFGLSRVVDAFSGYADSGVDGAAFANRRLALDPDALRSVRYIAPEQLRAGAVVDARADIWSLGVILHELIAGRPPFVGETVPATCHEVVTAEAQHLCAIRPNVPGGVDRAVRRCLQRDPAQRFANLPAMAQALAGAGTSIARASCERIERLLGVDGSANVPIPLVSRSVSRSGSSSVSHGAPHGVTAHGTVRMWDADVAADPAATEFPAAVHFPAAIDRGDEDDDDATDDEVPTFKAPASGRIVALALVMLCALGAAAFAGMYESVHGASGGANANPALVTPAVR
jgi:serine/threonine-protein kinase